MENILIMIKNWLLEDGTFILLLGIAVPYVTNLLKYISRKSKYLITLEGRCALIATVIVSTIAAILNLWAINEIQSVGDVFTRSSEIFAIATVFYKLYMMRSKDE